MNDIENINSTSKSFLKIRTGIGYDVHAFKAGNELILCGLKIPFNKSLKGHSDADVVMHAITDAIYGAIAGGDIGTWFPPNDIKWKNSNSEVFLKHANSLLTKKNYVISNLDCTIICEEPKIQPYTQKMRINMENILQITKDQISIKATTTEKLGFTGRKEGIAAQAIITVQKND
jgi:2-C-methyl-D-erythritol 4-phosphate cytidylyltransferase/2-C-methyl-D-erythritol 2,4-cyclodiphosphate synthase